MIMAQNEYEKIVKAMADKGVPHLFFEILADLRKNEINNSKAIDGIEFAVATALNGCKDFENNDAHEGNYLQVIRKLVSDYKRAIDEIAESHSVEEFEVDGTMCFTVTCGCEFCEQWRMLNEL
jgi:hypothetical protein